MTAPARAGGGLAEEEITEEVKVAVGDPAPWGWHGGTVEAPLRPHPPAARPGARRRRGQGQQPSPSRGRAKPEDAGRGRPAVAPAPSPGAAPVRDRRPQQDPALQQARRSAKETARQPPARPARSEEARPESSRPAPKDAPRPARQPGPRPEPRPKAGLGLAWAVALVAATLAGAWVVAILVVPVAALAAASSARSGGRGREPLWAAVGAAVVPVAAIGGALAGLAAALAVAVAAVLRSGGRVAWRPLLSVVAPGAAAGSLVIASHAPAGVALCLASAVCLFDVASYLMGTGPTGGVAGAVSGALTVVVFAFLVAAVINPPFDGVKPWVMCGLVAVGAPAGVVAGRRLAGGRSLPALRRLDSLLIAGPAWVLAAQILLR